MNRAALAVLAIFLAGCFPTATDSTQDRQTVVLREQDTGNVVGMAAPGEQLSLWSDEALAPFATTTAAAPPTASAHDGSYFFLSIPAGLYEASVGNGPRSQVFEINGGDLVRLDFAADFTQECFVESSFDEWDDIYLDAVNVENELILTSPFGIDFFVKIQSNRFAKGGSGRSLEISLGDSCELESTIVELAAPLFTEFEIVELANNFGFSIGDDPFAGDSFEF
jgi:hypothetical protein